jgi:hypothetical protein
VNISIFALIFGIVTLGAGLGLCGFGVLNLLKSQRYRRYPAASGIIKRLELKERKGYNRMTNRLISSYIPDLEYTYKVDGKTYTGKRFTFQNTTVNEKLAGRMRETFAPGNKVKVFYNPDDPQDAVVNTSGGEIGWTILFGSIFLVFGIYYLIGVLNQ